MNINENTVCAFKYVLNTTTRFSQESGRHGHWWFNARQEKGVQSGDRKCRAKWCHTRHWAWRCCCMLLLNKDINIFSQAVFGPSSPVVHQIIFPLVIGICRAPLIPKSFKSKTESVKVISLSVNLERFNDRPKVQLLYMSQQNLIFHYKQQTINRKGCGTLSDVGVGGGGTV